MKEDQRPHGQAHPVKTAVLLVTCCLEGSRAELLRAVIDNLTVTAPNVRDHLTVIDNASTVEGVTDGLTAAFPNVWQVNQNVGYWTAIDWWLRQLGARSMPPAYTYIIESDMFHYGFDRFQACLDYLDQNPDIGSVRLHEYSVADRHLYNKDRPRPDSRRALWQSHVNKVTGQPVKIDHSAGDIWSTTFLTQLPALNRFKTMVEVFADLRARAGFTELDFQAQYWARYQRTAILDGGLFNCNANPHGSKIITGSWTSQAELKRIGYQATRQATIIAPDRYTVTRI